MDAILDLPEMRAWVRRWTVAEYEKLGDETKQVEVYRQPAGGIYLERRIYGRGDTIENSVVSDGLVPVDTFFA